MITLHGTKQKEETLGLIALAWQDAKVGDEIEIVQPNDLGGKSLEKLILSHFPSASSDSRNKSRYINIIKTKDNPDVLAIWLEHTQLRFIESTGFYSMPGLFGWNKIDVGSALLLDYISELKGVGADFGCGYGYLSKNVIIKNEKIKSIYCFDCDNRAIEASIKNIDDSRAIIKQADCTDFISNLPPLDFIVMNPPFHDGGDEDKELGQKFIQTASRHLRKRGALWMVANRHLPYEKVLADHFGVVGKVTEEKGFKIYKALK